MALYSLYNRLEIRQSGKLLLPRELWIECTNGCRFAEFCKLPVADPGAKSHSSERHFGKKILLHGLGNAMHDNVYVIRIAGPVRKLVRAEQCARASVEGRLQI